MTGKGNEAQGGMEYVKGKLQWLVGKITGNRSMQARGAGHQAKGGARYEAGKAQGAMGKLTKK